ncbi:MAG: ATP-dependent 6-phosphofructokinase [Solirubrobacterales bacterium]|nr:ATP-dependent 6-phosphofructokinase [Solirubrobacterales bacterium]
MRIGLLTGGGDCPGLNAVIRSVVVGGAARYGHDFIGYRDGWRGPLERDGSLLTPAGVRDLAGVGGTVLGSSRTNPLKEDDGIARITSNLAADGVDALIAIGGDDTLGVARTLNEGGVRAIGVPKTVDNDLAATDYTFGFDTAVNIAVEAVERLRITGQSHHRTMVVEVMGRHAGWIAFHTGLGSGAEVTLIPEQQFELERVCGWIGKAYSRGRAPVVVVAEGAMPVGGNPETLLPGTDEFGHARLGGIANWLEREIAERAGHDTRATILGHIQRGGAPSAFDRVLATRLGLRAVEAAENGEWGTMAALRGTRIEMVPLADAVAVSKTVPPELYAEAELFFG